MKKIYSRVLMEDGSHITLDFNPGQCEIPYPFVEGETVTVVQIGHYSDDDIDADIVTVRDANGYVIKFHQTDGLTPLHITRECRNSVSPVQAGVRAREKGYVFDYADDQTRVSCGIVGYYYSKLDKAKG